MQPHLWHRIIFPRIVETIRNDKVVIASPEDDNQILAWEVHNGKELYYLYVKYTYRHMGLGRMLLEHYLAEEKVDVCKSSIFPRFWKYYNGDLKSRVEFEAVFP